VKTEKTEYPEKDFQEARETREVKETQSEVVTDKRERKVSKESVVFQESQATKVN